MYWTRDNDYSRTGYKIPQKQEIKEPEKLITAIYPYGNHVPYDIRIEMINLFLSYGIENDDILEVVKKDPYLPPM